ncbi:MAG: ATP-binding protein [Sphingomonas sp.]|jgi:signal transduction histidine kinase
MQRGTLASRISIVLVALFVLLQLVIFAVTAAPRAITTGDIVGLPDATRLNTMADVMERTAIKDRAAVADAFDGALYHVAIAPAANAPSGDADTTRLVPPSGKNERTMLLSGRRHGLNLVAQVNPWPGWLTTPPTASVRLQDGAWLVVTGRPSSGVQLLLRRRAILLGLGGIVALVALVLAVRATTLPLVRIADEMRTFAGNPETPDLKIAGSREMRDVATAYNEMKSRIADLMAQRTRILAAIAHDMRTYLTRLRLRSEFIDDTGQRARAISDLEEMRELLDDTLLLAAGSNEADGPRERMDLGPALVDIVASHREAGEPVTLIRPDGPALAMVRRLAFRRIVANLVDNALRHADSVAITLADEGTYWRIEVADDGPGAPADLLPRLGEAFGRADPSRDRTTGGAGLGLAIVRALAAEHGGDVTFANKAGKGFVATVWLPRDSGEDIAVAAGPTAIGPATA